MWRQDEFAAALVDRQAPVPDFVTSWAAPRPLRRFGVYRNNVAAGLAEALAVRYPVVQRLVGEEFFGAMAGKFALANLPASPVLIHYGGGFAEFIAGFPPAAGVVYLADVARLESACWEAYHAADVRPLEAAGFAAVEAARMGEARLVLIPSAAVLGSLFPVVSIWRTNSEDAEVGPVDLARAEAALVARPGLQVEVRRLPAGALTFLALLKRGGTLAEAAEAALAETPEFDLAANLGGLIALRIVAEIHLSGGPAAGRLPSASGTLRECLPIEQN